MGGPRIISLAEGVWDHGPNASTEQFLLFSTEPCVHAIPLVLRIAALNEQCTTASQKRRFSGQTNRDVRWKKASKRIALRSYILVYVDTVYTANGFLPS
jgi:hypothetical protein